MVASNSTAPSIPIGARVTVRSKGHWMHGQWGIVRGFDGANYHVSPFGGDDAELIFARRELIWKR